MTPCGLTLSSPHRAGLGEVKHSNQNSVRVKAIDREDLPPWCTFTFSYRAGDWLEINQHKASTRPANVQEESTSSGSSKRKQLAPASNDQGASALGVDSGEDVQVRLVPISRIEIWLDNRRRLNWLDCGKRMRDSNGSS